MQRINIHNWYIYSLGLHLIYIEEQPQHLIISLWIQKHRLTQVFQGVRCFPNTSLNTSLIIHRLSIHPIITRQNFI